MGRDEEFEGEEGQSLLASILAIVITLLLVGAVIAVAYFRLFKGGISFQNQQVVSGVPTEAPVVSPEAENTPEPMPESKPVTEVGEENPTGMGQDPEETQLPAVTPEAISTPEPVNVEAGHNFTEVNEVITAKDATNLRNMPGQGEESKVMVTLYNGQVATRVGISDSGWSKVKYDGKTYYAVSSYLTTDLTPPTPVPEDDGIRTVFTERDEMVAPKIEVNLRTLPSVTNPESVVVVKLPYGTQVRRTGINTDVGWSRVEYEGQVLYCVSSYVFVVEQAAQ